MMPSRELSSEGGAQEVTVESNGVLSCYRKCDRLVNNKQQRGLSWGSTVYWLLCRIEWGWLEGGMRDGGNMNRAEWDLKGLVFQ